jgi:hypothetical protein
MQRARRLRRRSVRTLSYLRKRSAVSARSEQSDENIILAPGHQSLLNIAFS